MPGKGQSFGFTGLGNRAFEVPAGAVSDFAVSPSPFGRARFRYNEVIKGVEVSIDGGGYAIVTTGSIASPWIEAAGVVRPQSATDDVVIGSASMSGAEKMRSVGDVRIEPDDTAGGFVVIDGVGDNLLSATSAGVIALKNGVSILERAGDPGATANHGKLYTKDDATVTQLFFQDSGGTVHQLTPAAVDFPVAQTTMGGNVSPTILTAVNTPTKIVGTTTLGLARGWSQPTTNRLQWDGAEATWAFVDIRISFRCSVINKTFAFYPAVNGTKVTSAQTSEVMNSSLFLPQQVSSLGLVSLSPGDYVEAWCENLTDATDPIVRDMQLTAIAIG